MKPVVKQNSPENLPQYEGGSINPTLTNQPREFQKILEVAEMELERFGSDPFSPSAFARLKEKISEYAIQLISESIKTAKRHQADVVSTVNVEQASRYLISTTNRKFYRHIGTLGGILLGTAVSNVVSMVTTNQYNLNGVVVTVAFTLVGSAMVAAHFVKDQ